MNLLTGSINVRYQPSVNLFKEFMYNINKNVTMALLIFFNMTSTKQASINF